jgi:hypothetical protein
MSRSRIASVKLWTDTVQLTSANEGRTIGPSGGHRLMKEPELQHLKRDDFGRRAPEKAAIQLLSSGIPLARERADQSTSGCRTA